MLYDYIIIMSTDLKSSSVSLYGLYNNILTIRLLIKR